MSTTFKRELGLRIRAARRVRLGGMTLETFGQEVARALGRGRPFSNVTVSNWETGRQEPSWEGLIAIALVTSLPLEYFAGIGTVEDYPTKQGGDGEAEHLAAELRMLQGASQRLDAEQQRILISQVEALLDTLGQQERSEGASA
jgi:transcriptional regulator with XRE-family HTH domain